MSIPIKLGLAITVLSTTSIAGLSIENLLQNSTEKNSIEIEQEKGTEGRRKGKNCKKRRNPKCSPKEK